MGGNAFDNPPTVRLDNVDYERLTARVLNPLKENFGDYNFYLLPSYRNKENFGDADVLVNHVFKDYNMVINFIKTNHGLTDNDVYKNSHVVSMRIENFQFDFVFCNPKNFETSKTYYNYSDFGNFAGRVAKRLGFKFGHDGLSAIYNYNNYEFAVNIISKDGRQILSFLGYDPDIYYAGFDTLEDIYKYAASTPFFNKEIYAYENRNHVARVRDRKRMAYRGFMEWLETAENLPAYEWETFSERGNIVIKEEFLNRVFEFFPDYKPIHEQTMKDFELWKQFKQIFNGENVSEWTGLSNIKLGIFMKHLKNIKHDNFRKLVVDMGMEKTKEYVLNEFNNFVFPE